MKEIAIALIRFYQSVASPALHTLVPVRSGCRFQPTCSEYLVRSIREQGIVKGSRSGLVRLSRCHPISAPRA